MKHWSLKEFSAALDRAAREYLAGRGVTWSDDYRLAAESCPMHGPGCVRVTYGVLREHFGLHRSDPGAVATELLPTMLPPEGGAVQARRERQATPPLIVVPLDPSVVLTYP
jgi:hypothetical protein